MRRSLIASNKGSIVQYSTVQCSTVQYSTVQYSTIKRNMGDKKGVGDVPCGAFS